MLIKSRCLGVHPIIYSTNVVPDRMWVDDFLKQLLLAYHSFTQDDSAVHIAEETSNAASAAPIAIMVGVLATEILGWLMYIAVSFATASVSEALQSKLVLPIGDVFLNVLGRKGTFVLWWAMVVLQVRLIRNVQYSYLRDIQYLCGCSQTVDASRVVFAFSRDNALPGSRWWKRINHHTQTPVNAVWFVILLSAACGLLSFSVTGFDSLASYANLLHTSCRPSSKVLPSLQCLGDRALHLLRYPDLLPHYVRKRQV